ncbi:hypothetical protein CVD19_10480 [Bacillus sp. T33-2]|nr:hypothetical protein CVD19_10480 [Bacillus sp. T33-2]
MSCRFRCDIIQFIESSLGFRSIKGWPGPRGDAQIVQLCVHGGKKAREDINRYLSGLFYLGLNREILQMIMAGGVNQLWTGIGQPSL